MYFKNSGKTIFIAVITAALCLVLSSFSPTVHSETATNFTLPCTIQSYGASWDGEIAFDLAGTVDAFVVMDTNGTLLNVRESNTTYGAAYNIAPDTIMFEGEPQVDGAASAPTYATHFWNLTTNLTEDFQNVVGHHDIQYDPVDNTFLTLHDYIAQVGNASILFDRIVQLAPNGTTLWSWDTYNYIPLSEASPFNETATLNGQTAEDFTHANDLDWDYNNGIIYLNLRNTNTFYKINQTTGDIIWACGEFGNFTLLGANGHPLPAANGLPPSLWYHSHDVKEVAPDVFTMFDNDYDNNTNPDNCHSRLMEVTLNETSMTAYVNWSWEAPTQYWTPYGGANLLLPNGDYIGNFGDPSHQSAAFPENKPWNFNNTGAVLVEVNPAGQIVKTFTFPVGWYIYRIETVTNVMSVAAPSPSALPSSTPSTSINSQTIMISVVLAVVTVAVVVSAVMFYMNKRPSSRKIGGN